LVADELPTDVLGEEGIECSEFIREQATQIKRNNYTAADVLPWPTYSNKSCMIPH
jgi:hypothetical protein